MPESFAPLLPFPLYHTAQGLRKRLSPPLRSCAPLGKEGVGLNGFKSCSFSGALWVVLRGVPVWRVCVHLCSVPLCFVPARGRGRAGGVPVGAFGAGYAAVLFRAAASAAWPRRGGALAAPPPLLD